MKYIFASICLLLSVNTYALFCPANFNSINTGDSIAQVQQVCGTPNGQSTYNKNAGMVEDWEYIKSGINETLPSKINFLFKDNKVVSINVTNSNLVTSACQTIAGPNSAVSQTLCAQPNSPGSSLTSSTSLCGAPIHIGESPQAVKFLCGEPIFTHRQEDSQTEEIHITELSYAGPSATTLIFENDKLQGEK